jgi:O-antigen/teichoic acid export membrane protein
LISKLQKHLPSFLRTKIEHRPGLLKVLNNFSWLFFDKVLRMGVGLLVGVWLARYLGPEQFGLLNFALAFTGLFATIASLGLQEIVVRDLVMHPHNARETLGTGFVLKLLGGLVAFIIVVILISLLRPDDTLTKTIVAIFGFTMILQSSEVVKYWFESQIESKFVVWIENGVFLIIAVVKVCMILLHASLLLFVIASFLEVLLVAGLLIAVYSLKMGRITAWISSFSRGKELLRDSWPLILSGLAIAIYMKIDQIMLGQMSGDKAVGIYSVAVRISEIWYFIPVALVASVFPSIVAAKKISEEVYYERLQKLYDLMIWMAITIAIAMTFLSGWVVNLLFGIQYSEAGSVLKIHIWAGINVALGTAWSKWILIENKQKLVLYGHILGSILNVIFNIFLIRLYGINGAAFSTLLSYWISALFIYTLYKPEKSYGLFVRSLNLIRIINGIKRN